MTAVRRFLVLGACALAPLLAAAQDTARLPYKLRYADRLQISVWKEEGLAREVKVLPDGSITFPLVGRLQVAGLTTPELESQLSASLKKFIPDANVTVSVAAAEGSMVYVIGKVIKPGQVLLTSPDTTVLHVLSMAGGLDRFADGNAISVMRGVERNREVFRVRYNELLRGLELQSNIVLQPGDTVVVP